MAKPISEFFRDLDFPLKGIRWSWGARSEHGILLRTWADWFISRPRPKVRVLGTKEEQANSESYGLNERIEHLEELWAGGIPGYTVIAEAVDKNAPTRTIKSFRDDAVFPIEQIVAGDDGVLEALLMKPIPVETLREHSKTHTVLGNVTPFSTVWTPTRPETSRENYQTRLPAMRALLIQVAKQKGTVTYGDVMEELGLVFFQLRHAMSRIGHECVDRREPLLTSLIVSKETGRCSDGFAAEFGVTDDEGERERCYEFWKAVQASPDTVSVPPVTQGDPIADREKRFAQTEVRTQQSAFRKAVFHACGGCCVISECDIPEVLEAAHLQGKDWRAGHNEPTDGILLRRDLHALYDTGLMTIDSTGKVSVAATVRHIYGDFDGRIARLPHVPGAS